MQKEGVLRSSTPSSTPSLGAEACQPGHSPLWAVVGMEPMGSDRGGRCALPDHGALGLYPEGPTCCFCVRRPQERQVPGSQGNL